MTQKFFAFFLLLALPLCTLQARVPQGVGSMKQRSQLAGLQMEATPAESEPQEVAEATETAPITDMDDEEKKEPEQKEPQVWKKKSAEPSSKKKSYENPVSADEMRAHTPPKKLYLGGSPKSSEITPPSCIDDPCACPQEQIPRSTWLRYSVIPGAIVGAAIGTAIWAAIEGANDDNPTPPTAPDQILQFEALNASGIPVTVIVTPPSQATDTLNPPPGGSDIGPVIENPQGGIYTFQVPGPFEDPPEVSINIYIGGVLTDNLFLPGNPPTGSFTFTP